MKKLLKRLAVLVMLVTATAIGVVGFGLFGTADYTLYSDKSLSEVFDGNISVVGSNCTLTVRPGSRVSNIRIAGSGNTIRIEEGAEVLAVQGYGENNTIYKPEHLTLNTKRLLGADNKISTAKAMSLDGL